MKQLHKMIGGALAAGGLLAAPVSFAADVSLVAKEFTKTLPVQGGGTQAVAVWGLEPGTTCPASGDPVAEWAGPPVLSVPADDPGGLTVNLLNCLPEAVSLVAPALPKPLVPVVVGNRVRSMDAEAVPNGGTQTYSWTDVRPGTFLLHSGTMPGKQVPMGLYAAVTKDSAAGEAYPGVAYDTEVVLLYSEIDPALNAAVAGGTYGTSIDYQPRYFLVNGNVGPTTETAAAASSTTLVRMLNAGLRNLTPTVNGLHWDLLAEDGHPYPYAKTQYSARLPAGGTMDAVFLTDAEGSYPVYDRRMSLTGDLNVPGGMLSFLTVSAPAAPPTAVADAYAVDEDQVLSVATLGVLANDLDGGGNAITVPPGSASLVGNPANGSVVLNADGSFDYTPDANFNGTDTFTYRANDGTQNSAPATVTITVNPVADAPVAVDDAYTTDQDVPLVVAAPGVLGNDTDVEGDATASLGATLPANGGVVLNADGSFTYTPNTGFFGSDSFSYFASGAGGSSEATVTITVEQPVEPPNVAPVASNDFATTRRNVPVNIQVLVNDTDADGTIDPTTVTIVDTPNKGGTAVPDPVTGVVLYTPKNNFRGTEVFTYTVADDDGAVSNVATVTVNVLR